MNNLMSNENNGRVAVIKLGSLSSDLEVPAIYLPKKCLIKSVSLLNGAALDALSDPKFTLSLKNGTTDVASLVFDDTAANIEKNVAAPLEILVEEIAAGSSLTVNYDETEAALDTIALTNAQLVIEYSIL